MQWNAGSLVAGQQRGERLQRHDAAPVAQRQAFDQGLGRGLGAGQLGLRHLPVDVHPTLGDRRAQQHQVAGGPAAARIDAQHAGVVLQRPAGDRAVCSHLQRAQHLRRDLVVVERLAALPRRQSQRQPARDGQRGRPGSARHQAAAALPACADRMAGPQARRWRHHAVAGVFEADRVARIDVAFLGGHGCDRTNRRLGGGAGHDTRSGDFGALALGGEVEGGLVHGGVLDASGSEASLSIHKLMR
jgi:hypothetical protein